MNCCRSLFRLAPLLMVIALTLPGRDVSAQKPAPPVPPNPQAPVLGAVTPNGLQRGSALEVTLTGTNLAGPTGVHVSFPAKITIPDDNKNGQDNAKLRVRIEVPGDAPIGYHTIRVTTARGISNFRMFCIDDLPEIAEVSTNRDKATPQELPVPCVVNGKADAEKSTWFKITVKAGERLSFDVLGRRLGSPIDPQMSIYEVKSKRELAHDNDSPGCQSDPRLSHVFKEGGAYLVEVKDVLNRGGPDYFFRLRIGDFPLATVPVPMAAQRGQKVTVDFAGPALAGAQPVTMTVPTDPNLSTIWIAPKSAAGLYGWPVALAVSNHPELVEQEPNNDPATANRVPVPGGITGRFQVSDDTDYYVFAGKKGQKLVIEAHTLELHSPSLVYMVLRNAKTKAEIAKTNPQAVPPADQVIDFTPPDDGDYLVEVQHLNYVGGPSEVYRLTITPSRPSFELQTGIERYDLSADGFVAMVVTLKRTGYTGPVNLSVTGHPDLTGQTTIAANQNTGVLIVKAGKDMPMGPYMITIVGEATIDKVPVRQLVNVRPTVSQTLANLSFPPRHLFSQIAIGVRERAPFTLTARLEQDSAVPGLPATIKVIVDRDKGFDEDIIFNPVGGLPPGVPPPALKAIPKGQKEITFQLALPPKTPIGQVLLTFSGKAKQGGKDFAVLATPLVIDLIPVPFELKVAPAPIKLAAGGKAMIKITAVRKGGYNGPIGVELRNLPAKVTAAKGTIAMGQKDVELEITAAADAPAASKMDVQAGGTATAFNNVANSSPIFTVIVEKRTRR
jgi:hypothetical protein